MRGRKPQPSLVATLHGNPGRRKRPAHEPQPTVATVYEPPAHLGEDARIEWTRLTTELRALGIITVLDLGLLAAWCTAWGDYVQAERELRREGLVVESRDRGPVRNPWFLVRNKAIEQMLRIGSEFGLSPASRPRLGRREPAPAPDQFTGRDGYPKRSLQEFLAAGPTGLGH